MSRKHRQTRGLTLSSESEDLNMWYHRCCAGVLWCLQKKSHLSSSAHYALCLLEPPAWCSSEQGVKSPIRTPKGHQMLLFISHPKMKRWVGILWIDFSPSVPAALQTHHNDDRSTPFDTNTVQKIKKKQGYKFQGISWIVNNQYLVYC